MGSKREGEKKEIIEAMIEHVVKGLQGQLDTAGTKELLIGLIAVGGVITIASLEPALLAAAIPLARMYKGDDRKRIVKTDAAFGYMRRRKYIEVEEHDSGITVRITKQGLFSTKNKILRLLPSTIPRPKRWDKQWRLIMFDIPTEHRATRNAFRTLIRRIGAVQLQKSVWIYPFDCSEQIELFKRFFELSGEELRVAIASYVGEDSKFRTLFKI